MVGLNPDQVIVFSEAAEALADVTGEGIPAAFDQLVQAAITGRGQILANLGVYVDLDEEMKRLAASTNRTVDQITRQERAMLMANAITTKAKDAIKELNAEMSDADRIQQIETRWVEMWDAIDKKVKSALFSVIDYNRQVHKFFQDNPTLGSLVPLLPGLSHALDALTSVPPTDTTKPVFGPGKGGASGGGSGEGLPASLRLAQLDAMNDRRLAELESMTASKIRSNAAVLELLKIQEGRGQLTPLEAAQREAEGAIQQIEVQRDSLQTKLRFEQDYHAKAKVFAAESTEKKIAEENRHLKTVQDITLQLKANLEEQKIAELRNIAVIGQAEDEMRLRAAGSYADYVDSLRELNERGRAQDAQDAELYWRGQIDMASAKFESDRTIAGLERQLLRSQLAFKLKLAEEEVDKLLELRQRGDKAGAGLILGRANPELSPAAREGIAASGTAQDIRARERAEGNFFVGWARGLQDYTSRTENAFNMANDMARRTAQTMEQGFQQLFFQPMEEGFEGFLNGLLNMTKQIVSQIAAQLLTISIIKPATAAFGAAFSVPGFATGGVGHFGSGTVAELHGTEAIVPLPDGRSIPVSMRLPGGGSPGGPSGGLVVNVINQAGAQVEARRTLSSDGTPELEIMVSNAVNRSIQQGRMDKSLRSRFGLSPGGG